MYNKTISEEAIFFLVVYLFIFFALVYSAVAVPNWELKRIGFLIVVRDMGEEGKTILFHSLSGAGLLDTS